MEQNNEDLLKKSEYQPNWFAAIFAIIAMVAYSFLLIISHTEIKAFNVFMVGVLSVLTGYIIYIISKTVSILRSTFLTNIISWLNGDNADMLSALVSLLIVLSMLAIATEATKMAEQTLNIDSKGVLTIFVVSDLLTMTIIKLKKKQENRVKT